MALSAQLEALLTELEKVDPVGAKEQRTILEKHAGLQKPVQEALLRQSDYSKFMDDNKAKLGKYDETMDWYKRTEPVHRQVVTDLKEANEKIARLQAEVEAKAAEAAAASAAAGAGGGDPQAIAKAVMEQMQGKVPTSAEVAKMVAAETEKQATAARERFFKEDVPAALAFQTAMNDVQWRYRDEFGKSLDRVAFAKFMTENKISEPYEALDRFVEKDRREKEIEAEVKKRTEEAEKKMRAEFVPGTSGGQGTGHLQVRLTEKKPGDPLFGQDVELGDNAAAMAAAAELRNEGRV